MQQKGQSVVSIVKSDTSVYDEIDFKENIKKGEPVFSVPKEEIVKVVRDFSELLKNGLQKM